MQRVSCEKLVTVSQAHDLSAAVNDCTKPVQNQTKQNPHHEEHMKSYHELRSYWQLMADAKEVSFLYPLTGYQNY